MNDIDRLLVFVRKTNPNMTKDKLIIELKKSRTSAIAILFSANLKK